MIETIFSALQPHAVFTKDSFDAIQTFRELTSHFDNLFEK
jgi:hypothetical protein